MLELIKGNLYVINERTPHLIWLPPGTIVRFKTVLSLDRPDVIVVEKPGLQLEYAIKNIYLQEISQTKLRDIKNTKEYLVDAICFTPQTKDQNPSLYNPHFLQQTPEFAYLSSVLKWAYPYAERAWKDTYGRPRIGYGSFIFGEKSNDKCSREDAERFFLHQLFQQEKVVKEKIHVRLTQGQYLVLLGFLYAVHMDPQNFEDLRPVILLNKGWYSQFIPGLMQYEDIPISESLFTDLNHLWRGL